MSKRWEVGYMKRFLVFSAVVGLLFASCTYDMSDSSESKDSSKASRFALDSSFISTVKQASGINDTDSITIRIDITGSYSAAESKTLIFSQLTGTEFTFSDIPLNQPFNLTVLVYQGSVLKYETTKEDVILQKSGQIDLSVLLQRAFSFAEETKYALYQKVDCGDSVNLYTLSADSSSFDLAAAKSFGSVSAGAPVFFDAQGNVWKYDSGILSSDSGKSIFFANLEGIQYSSFTTARSLNVLYGFGVQTVDGAENQIVTKFPNVLNDVSDNFGLTFTLSASKDFSKAVLYAVHNDGTNEKIYVLYSIENTNAQGELSSTFALAEFDLTNEASGTSVEANVVLDLDNVFTDIYPGFVLDSSSITDMLCEKAAVYILVKDVSAFDFAPAQELRSRGAIIKYDISSGEVAVCGFSSEQKLNTDFEAEGMYVYYKPDSGCYLCFKDEDCKKPWILEGDLEWENEALLKRNLEFPSVLAPLPAFSDGVPASSYFYGPSKFIAIKQNKLIVADDGIAFFTDSNNALCYKNVNRLVSVDLQSFALEVLGSTTATFDFEQSGTLFGTAVIGSSEGVFASDEDVFFTDDTSSDARLVDEAESSFYLGIPSFE